MSQRDSFPPGVPCWVDVMGPDLEAAKAFYAPLMGWEMTDGPPQVGYSVAHVEGRAVAGVGSRLDVPAAWTTYVCVDRLEPVVEAATAAGGSVLQEPLEVGPPGRLAVLADPAGAVFGLWEPGERRGAERVNEPGAWAMSALLTEDAAAAQAFYGALFGWTFDEMQPGLTMCRRDGYVGGEPQQPVPRDVVAAIVETPAGQAMGWSVDFWVADADAAAAHAAELGGSVVEEPHEDVPMFRRAVLADPAGAVLSVSQLLRQP